MGSTPAPTELTVHDLRESIGLLLTAMGSLLPRPISSAMADRLNELSQMAQDAGDTNLAMLGKDFAKALVAAPPPDTGPRRH